MEDGLRRHRILFIAPEWDASEAVLHGAWNKLVGDGLVQSLFYDGYVRSFELFKSFLLVQCRTFVLMRESELVALFWLNSFRGRTAQIHCTGFRSSFGRRRNAPHYGNKCIKYCLTLPSTLPFREYLVDTIVGVTPASNRLAVKFNERAGMRKLATIPGYCTMAYQNGLCRDMTDDAVLTIATRETMGIAEGAREEEEWEE